MPVQPIPSGYDRLMAYITPSNAANAIEFYKQAFGAAERMRVPAPNDKIGHAELIFGDSVLMLADEPDDQIVGYRSPSSVGATTFAFTLYVEDVDAAFQRAVHAGATEVKAPKTEFYGDREGRVQDPFGYVWSLMTQVEDVSPEELRRRAEEIMGQAGS